MQNTGITHFVKESRGLRFSKNGLSLCICGVSIQPVFEKKRRQQKKREHRWRQKQLLASAYRTEEHNKLLVFEFNNNESHFIPVSSSCLELMMKSQLHAGQRRYHVSSLVVSLSFGGSRPFSYSEKKKKRFGAITRARGLYVPFLLSDSFFDDVTNRTFPSCGNCTMHETGRFRSQQQQQLYRNGAL